MSKVLTKALSKMGIMHVSAKKDADLSNFQTNFDLYGSLIKTKRGVFFFYGKSNRFLLKVRRPFVRFRRALDRVDYYSTSTIKAIAYKKVDSDFDSYEDAILVKTKLRGDELDNQLDYDYEHGCHCYYDCCGHWFGGIWTHKTKHLVGDYFIIYYHSSRNV